MAYKEQRSTLRHGQLLIGKRRQNAVAFTEQEMDQQDAVDNFIGTQHVEATPLDRGATRVRVLGNAALPAALVIDSTATINLPSVLKSLSIVYVKDDGSATYTESGSAVGTGTYSIGLSLSGDCQASATCIPKAIHNIQNASRPNMPVKRAFLYATDTADVLSQLTTALGATVNAWPNFKEESISLTLYGQKKTGTARSRAQGSLAASSGGSSSSLTTGVGDGYDVSNIIEQVQLPNTLHGAFSLSASSSQSSTAVSTIGGMGSIGTGVTKTTTITANGSVTPSSISATAITDIPASGLYLYSAEFEPYDVKDIAFVHAIVFDFANA